MKIEVSGSVASSELNSERSSTDREVRVIDIDDELRLQDTGDHPCVVSLLEYPDSDDYVIQNLSRTEVDGKLVKRTDLVVAGRKTRELMPKAAKYPMHLRRTYYEKPETSPQLQCERLKQVFDLAGGTEPIGGTENIFRCTYLPGHSLDKISPFVRDNPGLNVAAARTIPKEQLVSLWSVLVQAHHKARLLHAAGICLGGINPRHVVVSSEGRKVHLVNMENAIRRESDSCESQWEESNVRDMSEILRLAVFTQMGLGQLSGPLAYDAVVYLPEILDNSEYYLKYITKAELSSPMNMVSVLRGDTVETG